MIKCSAESFYIVVGMVAVFSNFTMYLIIPWLISFSRDQSRDNGYVNSYHSSYSEIAITDLAKIRTSAVYKERV